MTDLLLALILAAQLAGAQPAPSALPEPIVAQRAEAQAGATAQLLAAREAHAAEHAAAAQAAASRGALWDRLAECESHGEWDYGPHSGWGSGLYHGGLQFDPRTWRAYGGAGEAWQAPREEQIRIAERVLAAQGWAAWPACSRKLGLR